MTVTPSRFSVDRSSDIPLGAQLAWQVRAAIAHGALLPGERMPAVRELAREVGVNVNTVRSVYARLQDQGLIDLQQGRGTFVAERAPAAAESAALAAVPGAAGLDEPLPMPASDAPADPEGQPGTAEQQEADYRAELRRQIAELERQIAHYTRHQVAAPASEDTAAHPAPGAQRTTAEAPRLLSTPELLAVRDELLARADALRHEEDSRQLGALAEHERTAAERRLAEAQEEHARLHDPSPTRSRHRAGKSGPPHFAWQPGAWMLRLKA